MRIAISLLLLLLAICRVTIAQEDAELFKVRYELSPIDNNGKTDALQVMEANMKLPLVRKEKYQVASGIRYESMHTGSDSLLGANALYALSGQLLINRKFARDRAIQLIFSAGVYSDFSDIKGEDFRYSFGIRYKTEARENFALSYGLLYSKQFFGNMIAPFVDFEWRLSNRLVMSGPFPISPRLKYAITERANLLLMLKPDNTTYRLSAHESNSAYFQKRQWNACVGADYKLTPHWLMSIKTGVSLRRQFSIYEYGQNGVFSVFTFDVNNSKRISLSTYEKKAVYGEITLAWLVSNK